MSEAPHVCITSALECADRAIAEFMISTGSNTQSLLAHIRALNKYCVSDGLKNKNKKAMPHMHFIWKVGSKMKRKVSGTSGAL